MSVTNLDTPSLQQRENTQPPLRLSYEEFFGWLNEDNKHAEWVNGEIVAHGPISFVECNLRLFVMVAMRMFVEAHNLGKTTYAPFQMRLEHSSRIPEIAFVAKENLHRIQMYSLEGPADLVVEIVSIESRGRDRGDKFFEYEEGGVREYWLLDPLRLTAEFYVLSADSRYKLAALDAEGRFHSVVLTGLWLQVDWLWQDPLPTAWDVIKAWGM